MLWMLTLNEGKIGWLAGGIQEVAQDGPAAILKCIPVNQTSTMLSARSVL